MTTSLLELNQRVNQVFGVCVEVQNSARPLQELAFQMELLARNGVVHAAKLGRDEGGSLGVLTQFLSELPSAIEPIVASVDERCRSVAESIAHCTHVIRIYALEVQALLDIARRHGIRTDDPAYKDGRDLPRLCHSLAHAPLSVPERRSVQAISDRIRPNVEEVQELTRRAHGRIQEVRVLLDDLRATARTARYISQCVRIEVARIRGDADRFVSFGDRVSATVDVLESRLGELGRIAADGQQLLSTLERGVDNR